jgi:hypothetical protein
VCKGANQVGVQRISRLGTIHRQHPDSAAVLAQDELVAQGTHVAALGNSLSLTAGAHNFLDPRKLDLLPAVQQRRRVALQRSGYLEPVEVRK